MLLDVSLLRDESHRSLISATGMIWLRWQGWTALGTCMIAESKPSAHGVYANADIL